MADIEIEAFIAGTKASKGITAKDIAVAAAGYDADRNPAPIVMGHPNDDQSAPSFGVLSSARAEGKKLFVTIKNLAQTAIDDVKSSRVLNRSMAFWHPDHPSNPNPGQLSIRHLGLLGGAAPAIPNMAPLRFSADADEIIVDGAPGEAVIFGAPEAAGPDLTDPSVIQGIASAVAAIINPPEKKEFSVKTAEELAAEATRIAEAEAALAAREQAITDKETQFAAAEQAAADKAKTARETANTEFAAQMVADAKFPAGHKDDLVAILNALPAAELKFSGDVSKDPADALKAILKDATPVFVFSATTPTGAAPGTSGDADAETVARMASEAKLAGKYKA